MQFRALELFCSVAECRSFSRAAAEFALTQSAVSQSIQQLEETLGVLLLDRSRRPLGLTQAGEFYFSRVQQLLRTYHRIEQEVRSLGEKIAGQLNVGAIYSIGSTYMPAAKQEFRLRHPEVHLRFEYASSEEVAAMVADGTVDIGLVSYARSTGRIRAIQWQQEPMRVICAADHPFAKHTEIELSQLDGCEMIGFDSSLKVRRVVDAFLACNGVGVDVTTEFDNIDSMIRAVEANGGISILPEATVRKEIADGSLRIVACKQLKLARQLGIIVKRAGKVTPAAEEFASMLLGRSLTSADKAKNRGAKPPTQGKSVVA
jgi:DNA-binding transcriptional LysR family regulator